MNLYDVWKEFFENLPKISATVEPYAKRSGITTRQALILILLNDFNDFDLTLLSDDIDALVELGYIAENNGQISVTGKGAILTKSFINKL